MGPNTGCTQVSVAEGWEAFVDSCWNDAATMFSSKN